MGKTPFTMAHQCLGQEEGAQKFQQGTQGLGIRAYLLDVGNPIFQESLRDIRDFSQTEKLIISQPSVPFT